MTLERITCPGCGRSVAIYPTGRMTLHNGIDGWCPGSGSTREAARIEALDWDELVGTIRRGLSRHASEGERKAAVAAFEDLLAKRERADAEAATALESAW